MGVLQEGAVYAFIPHSGRAKRVDPIELPSRTWASFKPTTQIQELVAVSYGLHPSCMTAKTRYREHAWPRQVAMFLTRELTGRSLPEIGRVFGGRDHSTVIHAIRAVKARMERDPALRADVDALRKALER